MGKIDPEPKASAKLLVTGGAGFIGSALIRHLIADTAHSVVNVDKLTYAGNLESLSEIAGDPLYSFEKVDISDRSAVRRVFRQHQPDAVVHLAAESHVDRSIDGPAAFIQTNVVGTSVLLENALDYWNELEGERRGRFRFIHVSTDEVYGDLHKSSGPFREELTISPQFTVLGEQGGIGPSRPRMASHVPTACDHDKLFQQLRTLSVPREAHSADHPQCAGRQTVECIRPR